MFFFKVMEVNVYENYFEIKVCGFYFDILKKIVF